MRLTSASNGTDTLTFEYNEDGLRQKKTVNNVDTDYFYNGSVLIGMQRGTDKLLFSYDASGNVVSVDFNGTEYYYLRNAQGDIVKLIDTSGATVVEYTYDTWGKEVQITGSLASTLGTLQPFRYRGYVYDEETGFYYLKSRYYDPTTGRFISADVLLSTGQGVLGHNCYAYCLDNPVMMVDDGGDSPFGILTWLDYALIHLMVQVKCSMDYGWTMEVYVKGSKGFGYLDLYDSTLCEYYEVKSQGSINADRTITQMEKYDVALVKDTHGNRLKLSKSDFGKNITRGRTKVEGDFQYGIYDIHYESAGDGLIQYKHTKNEERARNLAATAITAIAVAVVVSFALKGLSALPALAVA